MPYNPILSPGKWAKFAGSLILFAVATCLYLGERAFPTFSLKAGFSNYPPQRTFEHLWFFALSTGTITMLTATAFVSGKWRALLYAPFFVFVTSPNPLRGAQMLLVAGGFWLVAAARPRSLAITLSLVGITFLLMAAPFWHPSLLPPDPWAEYNLQMWGTLLLGYTLHARVFAPTESKLRAEYWEFLLCPILYFLPGLLNVFLFGYFLKRKDADRFEPLKIIHTFATSLVCLMALSLGWDYMETHGHLQSIREQHYPIDSVLASTGFALYTGFIMHLLSILHHTGSIYFSISVARCMGYGFRFDTKFPLISRNPMEYFGRMHNYFRDYMFNVSVIPGVVFLRKFGLSWRPAFLISVVSFLSIASILHMRSPRPLQAPRTAGGTAVLAGIIIVALAIHLLAPLSQKNTTRFFFQTKPKPVSTWSPWDYFSWALTNFLFFPTIRFLAIFLR